VGLQLKSELGVTKLALPVKASFDIPKPKFNGIGNGVPFKPSGGSTLPIIIPFRAK
jgi:hypothetical protein